MKHYNIKIYGRVQGVFFRDFTRSTARFLGLKGFVKNRPDGSVYTEAEGDEAKLVELIRMCRKGPDVAHVDTVDIEEGEMKGFGSFEIRY